MPVVPIFCAVIIVFVYFDQTISRKAVEAGKKLESGVNTVADSVEREVAQLSPVLNKTRVLKPAEEVAAVSADRRFVRDPLHCLRRHLDCGIHNIPRH